MSSIFRCELDDSDSIPDSLNVNIGLGMNGAYTISTSGGWHSMV